MLDGRTIMSSPSRSRPRSLSLSPTRRSLRPLARVPPAQRRPPRMRESRTILRPAGASMSRCSGTQSGAWPPRRTEVTDDQPPEPRALTWPATTTWMQPKRSCLASSPREPVADRACRGGLRRRDLARRDHDPAPDGECQWTARGSQRHAADRSRSAAGDARFHREPGVSRPRAGRRRRPLRLDHPGRQRRGVRVIDCEWAWNFTHEDLLRNSGGVRRPAGNSNYGTAVAGEIGGDRNDG